MQSRARSLSTLNIRTKLLHLSCATGSQCKVQREGFDAFGITLLSMLWEQQFPSTKSFMQYSKQFLGPRSYENLRKTWTWRKHEWNCLVNKEAINKCSYWRLRFSVLQTLSVFSQASFQVLNLYNKLTYNSVILQYFCFITVSLRTTHPSSILRGMTCN